MSEAREQVDTVRMWEIARYVEAHPENHEQRWRLAKKMYAAWEYRLALEHLLVLKNDWQRKINVFRYLAATYYRLGRYDDAERELREALEYWTQDLGLREQLARVLETAGNREAAAEAWEQIKKLQPDHHLAGSAVRRLRQPQQPSPQEDLHIGDSDSGIDLNPGQVCSNCGAQNGEEFERCWQCHASLPESAHPRYSTPKPTSGADAIFGMAPETFRLAGGLTVVGLLTLCLYLSLKMLLNWRTSAAAPVVESLQQLFDQQLGLSRACSGAAILLLSPVVLTLAVRSIRPPRPLSGSLLTIAALIFAALLYLSSWLPLDTAVAEHAAAVCALALLLYGKRRLRPLKAAAAALLNYLLLLACGLTVFTIAEYFQTNEFFNPLRDIPAMRAHAPGAADNSYGGIVTFQNAVTPLKLHGVTWESTGSPWLDRRAGLVAFTLSTPAATPNFKFEIQDTTGTCFYEPVTSSQWTCTFLIRPSEPYSLLTAAGDEGVPLTLTARGFLKPALPLPAPQ